jgi:subtilase family serine protease
MPNSQIKKPKPNFTFPCTGCPDGFNNTKQFDETPSDFATIYNVTPLYKATKPITGKGQTVVVLEISDIQPADVATCRKALVSPRSLARSVKFTRALVASTQVKMVKKREAALDAEWAGAIAPDAEVELASCVSPEYFRFLRQRITTRTSAK